MTIRVLIPKAGMGTAEGTLLKWFKAVGEIVREGEPLAEIEFAKAVQELPSPVNGRLVRILLTEGETADVHTVIAEIEEEAV